MLLKDVQILDKKNQLARVDVLIENGKIAKISKKLSHSNVIPLNGYILMPGLMNAHTHVAMSFFRGLGHEKPEVIEKIFFPTEKKLSSELIEPLSYSYIVAGIKSGVTCFVDHYYFSKEVAKAFEKLKVRAVVAETLADIGGAFPSQKKWTEIKKLIENWPFSNRILPAIGPHATDTVSFDFLKELSTYATQNKIPLHMHLSQTFSERKKILKKYKMTPVELAKKAGALTEHSLVAHLVSASEKDIQILKQTGATVAFCPSSQIIYEKLSPLELFLKHDIALALGTDCAACNDGGDMLSEVRITALLAKSITSKEIPPRKLLDMVTKNAALGISNYGPYIKEGNMADLVALKPDIAVEPHYDFLTNWIYSYNSRHVHHVMVDGQWILWDQKLVSCDEKTLKASYLEAMKKVSGYFLPRGRD